MMELNLQRQTVTVNEAVYSGAVEQPLECDVLLPDYCPDIQKILRCEVSPSLLSAPVSGEKLTVDGMAVVHLYYLSEDGCLRHAEYKIPYTKTIELRSSPASPSVHVTQSIDYFNCRAVSPRRLDMRGAVSIQARVSSLCEEQIVCGADGAGMQFCSDRAENTVLLPQSARQLSVREELELGYGKPAIGNIIRYTASADVSDYKVISGKVVTKGELSVRIIYQCEEDPKQLELMEYAIPVSQVVDVEGVDEECVCNVWYDVCGLDVSPKRNGDGENRVFALEAAVNACVCAHRRVELDTCCDCYSTLYECKQSQKQLPFLKLLDVVSETCTYKESIDLPDGIRNIIDLWCAAGAATVRIEPDCAVVSGRLTICMFACDEEGSAAYHEQVREFTHKVAINGPVETVVFAPAVRADTAAFTLSGHEKIEVRCGIKIRGSLYSQYRKNVLCDVAVDESRPKTRQENLLYLYYAGEQEQIWEIAKRYNTSVEAIREGNQLEGSVIGEKTMLLIPMK